MSISHQSVIRKSESIHLSNIRILEGLLTPGYMIWGRPGGQNTEHPHALVILSSFSFFWLQMHFMVVLLVRHSSGKLRCSGTALMCFSCLPRPWLSAKPVLFWYTFRCPDARHIFSNMAYVTVASELTVWSKRFYSLLFSVMCWYKIWRSWQRQPNCMKKNDWHKMLHL